MIDRLALLAEVGALLGASGSPAGLLERAVEHLAVRGLEVSVWRRTPGGWAAVAGRADPSERAAAEAARQGRLGPSESADAVVARVGGAAVGAVSSESAPSAVLGVLAALFAPALGRLGESRDAGRVAPPVLGKSKAMQAVWDQVTRVAGSDATVLLRGESGVGKELVAQTIHARSPRSHGPFVAVNCAALPRELLESELFGHERGAFTGATQRHVGRFEQARGGTLFLDELGDLPPAVQIALLRVLQEREFRRVGGSELVRVDARVITATHRDLEQLIASGEFRADLYYRLNVFPIRVPPLRERRDDITLLADHFVGVYSRTNHKSVKRISTPAIDMLMSYHWPGNVRELANCIERAVLVSDDEVIHSHHLPPTLQTAEATGTIVETTLEVALERLERELLVEALKNARGNRAQAARVLGLTERVMGLRVEKHGIDATRFKTRRRRSQADLPE
jgi:transcriptional regulator with GAF, ATPase, and Fis domain